MGHPPRGRSQYAKIPFSRRFHAADRAQKIAVEVIGDIATVRRNQVADTAAIFLPQQAGEQFKTVIVLESGRFPVQDALAVADHPVTLLLRSLAADFQIPDEGELRFGDFRQRGKNLL